MKNLNCLNQKNLVEITKGGKLMFVKDGYDWTRFYDDNQHPPTIFHGSSTNLLESILEHGLDKEKYPLSSEELSAIPANFRGHIEHRKKNDLSLTLCYKTAANHARKGSEMLEVLYQHFQIIGCAEKTENELFEKLESYFHNHKPVVFFIQTNLRKVQSVNEDLAIFKDRMALQRLTDIINENRPVPVGNEIGVMNFVWDFATKGPRQEFSMQGYLPFYKLFPHFQKKSVGKIIESLVRNSNYAVHIPRIPPQEIIGYEILEK